MKSRRVLIANDGCILTNGTIFGRQIALSQNESENDYLEISVQEYEKILKEQENKAYE